MAERRVLWRFWQAHLHPEQLVFIDETGAHTKLARLYGRALRGQRLVAKIPHGNWKTTTFVGALRVGGITAPLVVDGPMNGAVFRAYVVGAVPEFALKAFEACTTPSRPSASGQRDLAAWAPDDCKRGMER